MRLRHARTVPRHGVRHWGLLRSQPVLHRPGRAAVQAHAQDPQGLTGDVDGPRGACEFAAVPPPFNIAQAMQEAIALHRQNRLREAEKLYARVLKANPEHFRRAAFARHHQGASGQMGEALRLISAAVKTQSARGRCAGQPRQRAARAQARRRRARLPRQGAGDRSERPARVESIAAPLCSRSIGRRRRSPVSSEVLRRAPGNGEALLNRGVALAELGREAEALDDFDAALRLAPFNPELHYNRGNALLQLGRHVGSGRCIRSHARHGPQSRKGLEQPRQRAARAQPQCRSGRKFRQGARLAKGQRRRSFQSGDSAAQSRRPAAAVSRIRMALETQRHARYTARLPGKLWLGEYPLAQKTILLHPNRAWATPSSSRVMCRSWHAPARASCWKSSRN